MPDQSEPATKITIQKAKVKRVQLQGKKLTFLVVADCDSADAVYGDLVRLTDGATEADVEFMVKATEQQKDWKIPGVDS